MRRQVALRWLLLAGLPLLVASVHPDVDALKCEAQVADGVLTLVLSYTPNAPVWVASGLPRQRGSAVKPDLTLAHVVPGDVPTVTRRVFPVPRDRAVERPEVPSWTRFGPGETYRGVMMVAWPLTAHRPYATPGPNGGLGTPSRVRCQLATVPADAGSRPPGYARAVAGQRLSSAVTQP